MKDIPDLVYFPDDRPGITRRRAGRGWSYRAPDGTRIDDRDERRRLEALAVPPAYSEVWICPCADGHLQATGRDARTRKQYRYHARWTEFRARRKFAELPAFGACLPALRRRIRADLRGEAGDRDFAVAAVLAMIDRLSLRVGSRDAVEQNGAYGATTLRPRHLTLSEDALELDYRGKGGRRIRRRLKDRRLAQVLHRMDDLPGASLVSWTDAGGARHDVTSTQVNAALRQMTGAEGVTAKTFRTWNGSVAAMEVAMEAPDLTIAAMTEAAAARLANTAAIARNSYVHPAVIDLAEADLPERRAIAERAPERRGLRRGERALLALIDP